MGRLIVHTLMLLLLTGALVSSFAAAPAIGIATARGSFLIDNATVQGNTTLFDGALVETSAAPSLVQLQAGTRMRLGSTSRGRVYSDRLVLEKGEGQMDSALHYRIEARSLQIVPDSSQATAHVALRGTARVAVAVLAGAVRVTTAEGTLLAKLEPGRALEFEPQDAGASAPFSVAGCLLAVNNGYLLRDDTAHVSFDVRAGQDLDLAKYAGKRIEVSATGAKDVHPIAGAAEVLYVGQIKHVVGACYVSPAESTAGGETTAGAAAKTAGMSGTKKAIIAGVVIAAAVGGTAVGLTGEDGRSPISR
jgi:hypothetical protein